MGPPKWLVSHWLPMDTKPKAVPTQTPRTSSPFFVFCFFGLPFVLLTRQKMFVLCWGTLFPSQGQRGYLPSGKTHSSPHPTPLTPTPRTPPTRPSPRNHSRSGPAAPTFPRACEPGVHSAGPGDRADPPRRDSGTRGPTKSWLDCSVTFWGEDPEANTKNSRLDRDVATAWGRPFELFCF